MNKLWTLWFFWQSANCKQKVNIPKFVLTDCFSYGIIISENEREENKMRKPKNYGVTKEVANEYREELVKKIRRFLDSWKNGLVY